MDTFDPEKYLKKIEQVNVAIIGLGYVGLPLAIKFAKKIITIK